jgi:hypothetical protein
VALFIKPQSRRIFEAARHERYHRPRDRARVARLRRSELFERPGLRGATPTLVSVVDTRRRRMWPKRWPSRAAPSEVPH